MPKGILEFNLPEERDDFETAQNGWKYKSVLHEFDQDLRRRIKYDTCPPEEKKLLEKLRAQLNEDLKDNGIDLYS